MRKSLLIAAAALATSGAAATPADAAFFKSAKYRVEVEGVQTTKWQSKHVSQGGCDSNSEGSGTEVVRFKNKGPVVVTMYAWNRSTPMFLKGRRTAEFDLDSRIARQGSLKHWGGQVCSYGDGTGSDTPPAPDCGVKRSDDMSVELRYAHRSNLLMLEQSLVPPYGPFYHCPSGGVSWPSLLDHRTGGKEVGRRLPPRDLLRYGKNVVVVAAKETRTTAESTYETTIRYTLSLTRLGKVRQG